MNTKTKTIILSIAGGVVGVISAIGVALVEPEAAEPEAATRPEPPRYCDRFPEFCKECAAPPCGEPIGLVCCEEGLGCFGVFAYSDCEGDIYSCDWGYQGRNADGTSYVECFD